ncbi:unnamed protein product [Lupinus luteus]|uniref:Serine-threonine/tyrosine-protein kinase catalytic domain-containing protein n=1 Tax=Lupinus luteus TaxID=3873 RepID=A0AAV1WRJ2_LUPLU
MAIFLMAELAHWCMREDPMDRPEMREILGALSQIVMSSIEWEASILMEHEESLLL